MSTLEQVNIDCSISANPIGSQSNITLFNNSQTTASTLMQKKSCPECNSKLASITQVGYDIVGLHFECSTQQRMIKSTGIILDSIVRCKTSKADDIKANHKNSQEILTPHKHNWFTFAGCIGTGFQSFRICHYCELIQEW